MESEAQPWERLGEAIGEVGALVTVGLRASWRESETWYSVRLGKVIGENAALVAAGTPGYGGTSIIGWPSSSRLGRGLQSPRCATS